MRKYLRALQWNSITEEKDDLSMYYLSLIQNHFRKSLLTGAIITLNWVVLRRCYFPQFGLQVTGWLRNTSFDLLPGLMFINYQTFFQISKFSDCIKYLDNSDNINNPFLKESIQRQKDKKEARRNNVKFLLNSMYWQATCIQIK